ncbi:MAG: hypothetical protein JW776_02335 [Candidatus Lokiarchaeota archaeon]|nr:hypothetical protein [Candidatus Lokiarchaeota archaeon]
MKKTPTIYPCVLALVFSLKMVCGQALELQYDYLNQGPKGDLLPNSSGLNNYMKYEWSLTYPVVGYFCNIWGDS